MGRIIKTQNRQPGKITSWVVTIAVILLVPLPFALYLGGVEWLTAGISEVPEEFIVTYLLGVILLLGGIIRIKIKDRHSNENHE